ncbi:PspC domain-containing protein [Paucibacter sp. Y2R2-4]|uniref:PspC domain-containing protein n=1 Tax=Paucibacter sp. Y2R2-4 TaxID=2893553 RepID=UPI0021E4D69E|nr:PspC domain-containing protein [Paucibacter sp. Y2R2-4]MCV2350430.1 PspC domain-containing protein [Paucibacter sp. Y2R2-4]
MSDSIELEKLAELHQRGVLSAEEFARAKERLLSGSTAKPHAASGEIPGMAAINELRRSREDRWLGGVCGGISRITGIDAWIWRLLFTLLVLCVGTGLFVYVLLWIFVPEDQ